MGLKIIRRIIDKTAAYAVSLLRDQPETVFTNRGAIGGVTFTLPTPAPQYLGVRYYFRGIADFAITVASAAVGDLVAFNDAAANSIAASTGGQIIGALIVAECIRTGDNTYKWAVNGVAVGHTYTIAT